MALNNDDLTIKIGAELSDITVDSSQLKELEDELTKVLSGKDGYDYFVKNIKNIKAAGISAFSDLGSRINKSIDIRPVLDKITSSLSEVKKEFKDRFEFLDTDTIENFTNALQKAFAEARSEVDIFRGSIEKAIAELMEAGRASSDMVDALKNADNSKIRKVGEELEDTVSALYTKAGMLIESYEAMSTSDIVSDKQLADIKTLESTLGNLTKNINDATEESKKLAYGAYDEASMSKRERALEYEQNVRYKIDKQIQATAASEDTLTASIDSSKKATDNFKVSLNSIQSLVRDIFSNSKLSSAAAFTGLFAGAVKGLLSLHNRIQGIAKDIENYIKTVVDAFKKVGKTITTVAEYFSDLAEKAVSAFTTIVTKVNWLNVSIKTIGSVINSVSSAVKEFLSEVSFDNFIAEAINLSKELAEIQNRVQTVFRASSDRIKAFAIQATDDLGMTTAMAEDFAASFGAALKSMGFNQQAIDDMSIGLTRLTADISSFYDIEHDIAKEKLFSGIISGQTKAIREFGVDVTQAALKEYALAQGYKTLYSEMSLAEKTAIRYQYVMEKLGYVHDDFKDTMDSTSNQLRILKNRLKELATIIGSFINVALNPFVHALNNIVAAVSNVAKAFASIVGIDWTTGFGGGKAALIEDVASGYDDVADAGKEAAEGLDKAGKAAKKALAPFHKLNILQNKQDKDDSKKDSLGGINIGDLGDLYEEAALQLPNLKEIFNNISNFLWSLDWEKALSKLIDNINNKLKTLPKAIKDWADAIQPYIYRAVNLFNMLVEDINWDDFGRTANAALYAVGKSLETLTTNTHFGSLGTAFGDFVNGLTEDLDAFEAWGNAVVAQIQGSFRAILTAAVTIKWEQVGKAIFTLLDSGIQNYLKPTEIFMSVYESLSGITKALNTVITELLTSGAAEKLAYAIVAIPAAVAKWLGSTGFAKLVSNMGALAQTLLDALVSSFSVIDPDTGVNGVTALYNGLKSIIDEVGQLIRSQGFKELAVDLIQMFSDLMEEVLAQLQATFGNRGGSKIFKEIFGISGDAFLDTKAVIDKYTEAFYPLSDAIDETALKLDYFREKHGDVVSDLDDESVLILYEREWENLEAKERQAAETAYILKKAHSELDITLTDGTKLTEEQAAALAVAGINLGAVNDGMSILTSYDIKTWLEEGTERFNLLSEAEKQHALEAAKAGMSYEEYCEVLNRSSANTTARLMRDKEEQARILEEDLNEWRTTARTKEELEQQVVDKFGETGKTIVETAKEASQKYGGTWVDNLSNIRPMLSEEGKGILDALMSGIQNSGTDVAAVTEDNVVVPITETLDKLKSGESVGNILLDMVTSSLDEDTAGQIEELTNTVVNDPIISALTKTKDDAKEALDVTEGGTNTNILGDIAGALSGYTDSSLIPSVDETRQKLIDEFDLTKADDSSTLFGDIPSVYNNNVSTPLIEQVNEDASEIQQSFNDLSNNVNDTSFKALYDNFKETLSGPLKSEVDTLIKDVQDKVSSCYDYVTNSVWGNAKGWFETNVWTPLTVAVEELGDAIVKAMQDSLEGVEDTWERLNKSVTSWANSMAKTLDSAASSADKLAESLKKAAAAQREYTEAKKLKVQSSGRNGMPSNIPGYANGAVLQPNRPHLALLGDQKRGVNVESPLSTMVEAFKEAAQNIEGGFSGTITIPVYVDGVLTTQKVITAEQMHNYRSNGR